MDCKRGASRSNPSCYNLVLKILLSKPANVRIGRYTLWNSSSLTRLLRVAAHDFDLLRCNGTAIVKLEIDILDEKSPDIVAEAVGI